MTKPQSKKNPNYQNQNRETKGGDCHYAKGTMLMLIVGYSRWRCTVGVKGHTHTGTTDPIHSGTVRPQWTSDLSPQTNHSLGFKLRMHRKWDLSDSAFMAWLVGSLLSYDLRMCFTLHFHSKLKLRTMEMVVNLSWRWHLFRGIEPGCSSVYRES